jgi:hypothetical protein
MLYRRIRNRDLKPVPLGWSVISAIASFPYALILLSMVVSYYYDDPKSAFGLGGAIFLSSLMVMALNFVVSNLLLLFERLRTIWQFALINSALGMLVVGGVILRIVDRY